MREGPPMVGRLALRGRQGPRRGADGNPFNLRQHHPRNWRERSALSFFESLTRRIHSILGNKGPSKSSKYFSRSPNVSIGAGARRNTTSLKVSPLRLCFERAAYASSLNTTFLPIYRSYIFNPCRHQFGRLTLRIGNFPVIHAANAKSNSPMASPFPMTFR